MDDGHCVNENKLIKTVVETYLDDVYSVMIFLYIYIYIYIYICICILPMFQNITKIVKNKLFLQNYQHYQEG